MAAENTEIAPTSAGAARNCGGGGDGDGDGDVPRSLHARSFKLRFAAQREQGRSYVSLVKPLGLPATVTGKFYAREDRGGSGSGGAEEEEAAEHRALERIRDMFDRGPRDHYVAPLTSSQVIGWYVQEAAAETVTAAFRSDRRLNHHIRDSAWLKSRLCVLAADDKLKQR